MAYPVEKVANTFLRLAHTDGKSISPMKLQKLIYLAHGLNLALHGEPLVETEPEAWQHGPVFRSLYRETRKYVAGPVPMPVRVESKNLCLAETNKDSALPKETLQLLEEV